MLKIRFPKPQCVQAFTTGSPFFPRKKPGIHVNQYFRWPASLNIYVFHYSVNDDFDILCDLNIHFFHYFVNESIDEIGHTWDRKEKWYIIAVGNIIFMN
jgi:hypothetical protein